MYVCVGYVNFMYTISVWYSISFSVYSTCGRVAIKDPPYVDSLFVLLLLHFEVSLSANGSASDRESFCRLFCAKHRTCEFFAVLISRPILRYEYYQIYCVLAALFSRFAFFCLANTLSFVSPSPSASRLRHSHEEESVVSLASCS